jgi:hypothetical protein
MKKIVFLAIILTSAIGIKAQTIIHTEDITNFWQTFDSTQTTADQERKKYFIQKYYLDKAGEGLKFAIKPTYLNGNSYTSDDWLKFIDENKEKLARIRPYTLQNLENQKTVLQQKFLYFKQLYPEFNALDIYFVVGIGDFGGNVTGKNVVVAAEVMANESPDWGISIVLHEFVHTMQTLRNDGLLQHTIMEGTADFVAELVNQKKLTETYPGGYIDFGNKNEKEIWKEYKKYMGSSEVNGQFFDWMYGSKGREINGVQMKDLGYFMGYTFCRAYYNNHKNKPQALKEIIEWDLSTPEKARAFLLASGYVPKRDLKFVQNFIFAPVVEVKKDIKKERYGYKLTNNEVVFVYKLAKAEDEKLINSLTVAGVFNGWNPNDDKYKLTLNPNRIYELRLPKSAFEKNKTYTFKFVKNGNNWLSIPEKALNVDADSGNLILKID